MASSFVGFAAYESESSGSIEARRGKSSDRTDVTDEELDRALKMCLKRDLTTRRKGLLRVKQRTSELLAINASHVLRSLGSWWGEHLAHLCEEDDWQLRVLAIETIVSMGLHARSRQVAAELWLWAHDADVARTVKNAWSAVFPKKRQALERHRDVIVERISSALDTDLKSPRRRCAYLTALAALFEELETWTEPPAVLTQSNTWRAIKKPQRNNPDATAERKASYRAIAAACRHGFASAIDLDVLKEVDPVNAETCWEAFLAIGKSSSLVPDRLAIPGFAKAAANKLHDIVKLSTASPQATLTPVVAASATLPLKYAKLLCSAALALGITEAAIALASRDVDVDISSTLEVEPMTLAMTSGSVEPTLLARRLPTSTLLDMCTAAEKVVEDMRADANGASRAAAFLAAVEAYVPTKENSLEQWWLNSRWRSKDLEALATIARRVSNCSSRLVAVSIGDAERLTALHWVTNLDDETAALVDDSLLAATMARDKERSRAAADIASSAALQEVNATAIAAFAAHDVEYLHWLEQWVLDVRRHELGATALRVRLLSGDLSEVATCRAEILDEIVLDQIRDPDFFARVAVSLLEMYLSLSVKPQRNLLGEAAAWTREPLRDDRLPAALEVALARDPKRRSVTALIRSEETFVTNQIQKQGELALAIMTSNAVGDFFDTIASKLLAEGGQVVVEDAIQFAILSEADAAATALTELRFGGPILDSIEDIIDESSPLCNGQEVWYRGERACIVVAAHSDPQAEYYTVRFLDDQSEKQTVRSRLSLQRDNAVARPPLLDASEQDAKAVLRLYAATSPTRPVTAVRFLASRVFSYDDAQAAEAQCDDDKTQAAWYEVLASRKQPLPAATRERARRRLAAVNSMPLSAEWLEAALTFAAVSPSLRGDARLALDATMQGLDREASNWLGCAAALVRGPGLDAASASASEATKLFVVSLQHLQRGNAVDRIATAAATVATGVLARRDRNAVRLLEYDEVLMRLEGDLIDTAVNSTGTAALAALDILIDADRGLSARCETTAGLLLAVQGDLSRSDFVSGLECALRDWSRGFERLFADSGKRYQKRLDVAPHVRPFSFVLAHRPKRDDDTHDGTLLAAWAIYRAACVSPGRCRDWFTTSRQLGEIARRLLEDTLKGAVVDLELRSLSTQRLEGEESDVDISVSVTARYLAAIYRRDECAIEMKINYAACHPLRSVSVDLGTHQGVSEQTARRWALQLRACADHSNAIAAVDQWRNSLDLEFKDLEPCPVCCGVLNPTSKRLPDVQCATCNNKFHASCLAQWFNKSHKSVCVICQQPFVAVKRSDSKKRRNKSTGSNPETPQPDFSDATDIDVATPHSRTNGDRAADPILRTTAPVAAYDDDELD